MNYGLLFKETTELIPLPIMVAHEISKEIDSGRKNKYNHIFGRDGKCQVSVRYIYGQLFAYDAIIISALTRPGATISLAKEIIIEEVLKPLIGKDLAGINILINPTGVFLVCEPYGDSGLTGRMIVLDTYGDYTKHSDGPFYGEDVSKVDRSASYYARFAAKALIDVDFSRKCEVCVSYSIGIANPIAVSIDSFRTGKLSDEQLLALVNQHYDFIPANNRKELKFKNVSFMKWQNMDTWVKKTYQFVGNISKQKQLSFKVHMGKPKVLHNFYKSNS